jgi:tRNA threonylcarbamoyladenosine biosynthesis protein TsaE
MLMPKIKHSHQKGSSSKMQRQVMSRSREDTFKLGETVGRGATGRLIIALIGDLGSGKTVFVQGLAKGLAVPKGFMITSPSYTLINEYPGRIPLFHADLYRLSNAMDIESTGLFDIMTADAVVAIEWAERICEESLEEDMLIRFDIKEDNIRAISVTGCGQTGVDLVRELGI